MYDVRNMEILASLLLYFPSRSKPIRFIEKSRPGTQMVCSSFSPGKETVLRMFTYKPV